MARKPIKTTGDSPNPLHGGGNLTALTAEIAAGIKKIEGLTMDRQSINEEIGAVKSGLEAKGIPKKALNMALQYKNMDPDKRENFDIAHSVVREAIGLTIQGDMFEQPANGKDRAE